MIKRYRAYASTVLNLILRDLRSFKVDFWGKFIDTCIMLSTTVIIFSYFLPSNGLRQDFGPFLLIGVIAGFGFFDVVGKVATMISDIEGDKTILYTISLPIPSWLVFFYQGLSWALYSSIMCFLLFPLGKILLFSQFDLTIINYPKLLLMFIMSNLFFGFFALWLSSISKNMSSLSHLFVRVINPLYMFGGYLYSWHAAYALTPIGGYINLANPLIYVMEGMRATTLGQEGYLPFWFSFGALMIFTSAFAWDAINRLKKRLDCV
jgi:ABC-2 type transport system permease protein